MRKLARIEALALGAAADTKNTADLRAERKALAERLEQLRDLKVANGAEWQVRRTVELLQQLNKTLGQWLAGTPAERVQAFREELHACRPPDRARLATRYGGEDRLAELIKLGHEFLDLTSAYQAAQKDTTTPEPARKLALRKAAGALGYFYGYNETEGDLRAALQDPDLATEFGRAASMNHDLVTVPDLVTWVGESEAEKLLAEAYALPVQVQLEPGSRTGALARRMLVDGKLKPARLPWSLVDWRGQTVDGNAARELAALFDALKKLFPELAAKNAGESDWNRGRGLASWAYALAASGRMDEAVTLITEAGPSGSGLPYHARITQEVAAAAWDLIMRAFGQTENTRSWDKLKELAGPANRGAELITFAAKQAAAAPKESESAKVWQARHGWSLIGEGKIEEGLAILTPCLELRPGPKEKTWETEWTQSTAQLFLLAKAVPLPELAKTWGDKIAMDFKNPMSPAWTNSGLFDAFASQQLAAGNFALLEEILRGRLTARRQSRPGMYNENTYSGEDHIDLQGATRQLADVLGRQGRHAEVVALLAESSAWGNNDLVQVLGRSQDRPWRPLPLVAAESLQAIGRAEEAIAIMEAELIQNSGYDPAYALYTRIRGAQAAPFFEKLWASDHYQERPLIWLASLQLAAGKVSDAEVTVKRAIATDPSDGEQPKGDRMRAYAVLREVALKQGDAAQAEFLAGVLAAIRRSEDADDLASAGLVARAIKEYQLALESFSDAYCIQSRLARRLAEENRTTEAAEHYKRAFELMPDSFGRVESHCFGCEQAFAGEGAQLIAEKVFTDLAGKPNVKPQVSYLLGYLRMEQERWDEAAVYFNKAVSADPDYLNAWVKLAEVLPNTARPRSEQDRVAFMLLALDPLGKHGSSGSNVRDLPALWSAYAAAEKAGLVIPQKLFPLGDKAGIGNAQPHVGENTSEPSELRTPSARLAKHEVLENVTRTFDHVYQWRVSNH